MKQVMNRVSKQLDSPQCTYLTYCYLHSYELVKENETKEAMWCWRCGIIRERHCRVQVVAHT